MLINYSATSEHSNIKIKGRLLLDIII